MSADRESMPVVCVDLDGVLNEFDGWKRDDYFHPVRPGAEDFLRRLNDAGYRVIVFTVRYFEWAERWLEENGLRKFVDHVTDKKPPAHVYLDDHAVCFRGDYDRAFQEILEFRPHWQPMTGPHNESA